MSQPSVRSSSTLTPIENLDHPENVLLGVSQRNPAPPGVTDTSAHPIIVHTQGMSVLQDIDSSQSDDSRTEPEMLHVNGAKMDSQVALSDDPHTASEVKHLQRTRTILQPGLRNAWNVSAQQDVMSNKSFSGSQLPGNDFFIETDNTGNVASNYENTDNVGSDYDNTDNVGSNYDNTDNVGSNYDNKKDVKTGNKEDTMHENDEVNGKRNTTHDEVNARKQLPVNEQETNIKRSIHIIDDSEDKKSYNKNIFDTEIYDDKNNNDRKDFSVDESFLGSDAVSGHSTRVSMTLDSMKLFKTEPAKSRRSSAYFEAHSPTGHNLRETFRKTVAENFIKGTRNSEVRRPKNHDATSPHLSSEAEKSGAKMGEYVENKQTGLGSNDVEDGGKTNKLFYLDMLKNDKLNKSAPLDAILQKHKDDSKNEDIKLDMCSNASSDSANTDSDDKSTINANTSSDKLHIHEHEIANMKRTESLEKQINTGDTFGFNYTEGSQSTDVQSTTSGENVHGQRDMSTKTWSSRGQYDPSDTFHMKPTEQEKGTDISTSAADDDKHTLASSREERRRISLTNESDYGTENHRTNFGFARHSEQGLLVDATEHLKTLSEVNVNEKENIAEERNINKYSQQEKIKGEEDGNNSSSKNRISDKSIKNSKSSLSNRQSNYKSIVEMKALDRLLTGPYSQNLIQKTPSPRRGTYINATKASTNRIQKQNQYIKLAAVDEENTTLKPTSEKSNRLSSSGKHKANNKNTGSAKSIDTNTRSSTSTFTLPSKEARPVKAGTNLAVENKPVPDKIKKPEVSTYQRQQNQTETKTETSSNLPVLRSEKRDQSEAVAPPTMVNAVTTEAVIMSWEGEKHTGSTGEASADSVEKMETASENMTSPVKTEQTQIQDNNNNLLDNQDKSEAASLDIDLDILRGPDTQTTKTDTSETGKKPTDVGNWSMTRAKMKPSLPKLVRTQGTGRQVGKTSGTGQSLDVKSIAISTSQDTQETKEPAMENTEELSNPKIKDTKETKEPAKENTEKLSNPKIKDTKKTKEPDKENIEKPSSLKIKDTKEAKEPTMAKTEKPSNPKIKDTKETKEPAKQNTEKPSNPKIKDTKETKEPAKENTEKLSNPKIKDTKETKEPAKQNTEKPSNPKIKDTKETKEPAMENAEKPSHPKIKDTKETKVPAKQNTEEPLNTKIKATKETKEPTKENTEEPSHPDIQDTEETKKLAVEKTEQPSNPKDPLMTPPASVVIVDETLAPQTQTNFLIDQVILQDILQKYKTKSTADCNNSTNVVIPNGSPGSPPPETVIGNGVSTFQDRSASKSVSIHSLTVPGLQSNPFSGEIPLDEDTISIYSRRDSVRQSFDSGSRKSVDYRIRNTALVVLPTVDEKPKSVLSNEESFIKNAIPFLPMKLAVLCLILNIIVPGSGTALSGLAILFCGQPRVLNKDDQILITVCANCMVGLAQLCTITFLLVGWFWSVSWGIEMVILSVQHEKDLKEQRTKELQSLALNAFGSPKRPAVFGT